MNKDYYPFVSDDDLWEPSLQDKKEAERILLQEDEAKAEYDIACILGRLRELLVENKYLKSELDDYANSHTAEAIDITEGKTQ